MASAILSLIRWQNALIAALGVALGAWWVGATRGTLPAIGIAMLAAVALTATANIWNDLADIDIDRIAHPERPLPSEEITPQTARWLAALSAVSGIILSMTLSPLLGASSVIVVALMFAYSPWLKRRGVLGNITVAVLGSLPFLYGAWAVGRPEGALLLVGVAAPLHLAREIAKDIDDAAADASTRRTLPVTAGVRRAAMVAAGALVAFFLLLIPSAITRPFFGVAMIPAMMLLLYAARVMFRGEPGSPRVFKLAMLCAMAAFLFARP